MKQDYRNKVRELLKSNLEGPKIVDYHGTSIEAIEQLAKTGKLLGTDVIHQVKDKSIPHIPTGYIYITPIKEKFKGNKIYNTLVEDAQGRIFSDAECYAETKGFVHYLVKRLGFLPKEADIVFLSAYKDRNSSFNRKGLSDLIKESHEHGVKDSTLKNIVEKAWKRKGVNIGLSNKIFEIPIEEDPECIGEALRIPVKGGLPIKYIGAIWPISDVDKRELNQLVRA